MQLQASCICDYLSANNENLDGDVAENPGVLSRKIETLKAEEKHAFSGWSDATTKLTELS